MGFSIEYDGARKFAQVHLQMKRVLQPKKLAEKEMANTTFVRARSI